MTELKAPTRKKFVAVSYWGVFIKGANVPLAAVQYHHVALAIRDGYKKEFENNPYQHLLAKKLVVKRCRMGRMLKVKS